MLAVYKREFNSYFTSMIGYIFIAIVIAIVGLYFMVTNLYNGHPMFSYTLSSVSFILIVAIPILTMKSISEDKKSKADQILLTSPITLTQLIMGKYLALVTVWLIPILIFCLCPAIIAMNGTSHLLSDYSSIFCFFIMGCSQIAIGLFVSALTESQVIAAVGSFAILMVLNLWDGICSFLHPAVENVLSKFSFTSAFINFASYQVFDVGGIILYLSIAFLFIFFTIQSFHKRRWN